MFQRSADTTKIKTGKDTTLFPCEACTAKFAQSKDLTLHLKVKHTVGKLCLLCNNVIKNSSNFISHLRTHSGEKPHACNLCSQRFVKSTHLHRHKRSHTDEKPFCCDVCQNKFTSKDHLVIHTRIHSGERPYACDQCEKR